jgi:hypothetical protein
MFAWLAARRARRSLDSLRRHYARLLEEARDLQRGGDIEGFAAKTAEAEAVGAELDRRQRGDDDDSGR